MRFWFTFGCNQPHENGYTIIEADDAEAARIEMFRRFTERWSMMYDSAETAGVEEYNLKEIIHPIYVGPAYNCLMNKNWKWPKAAHLFCGVREDIHKLHLFAAGMGLKRSWFQDHKVMPHYDLTIGRRRAAITAGATAIDQRNEVDVFR